MDLKKLNQKIGEYRNIIIAVLVILFGLLFIFKPYLNASVACGGSQSCTLRLLYGHISS